MQINKKCWEYTDKEWDDTFSCNLKPVYKFIKYGISLLKKTQGNIINIGSIHTICSSDSISSYSSSKSAIIGLTKNLAIELGEFGIRVNALSPGAINTSMLRDSLYKRKKDYSSTITSLISDISNKHILGKIGEPYDVSSMVYSICNNNFMTGSHVILDGGVSIKLNSE